MDSTNRMIADGLTKDQVWPNFDLLRSCIRAGSYQISPEEHVIQQQALERERRLQSRQQKDSKAMLPSLGETGYGVVG